MIARRTARLVRHRFMVVMSGALTLASCEAGGAGSADVVRRDSAGIEIIESRAPLWSIDNGWSVAATPSLEIGTPDGDENDQLFQVRDVARLSDGRFVVLNAGTSNVRIYSPSGEHLSTIGRAGAGPGEFRFPRQLWITPGDSIIVGDLDREHVFDPAGSIVISRAYGASAPRDRYPDGSLLSLVYAASENPTDMGQLRPRQAVTRWSFELSSSDTLVQLSGDDTYRVSFDGSGISQFTLPFGHQRLLTLANGQIYTSDGSELEVAVLDDRGNWIRRIRGSADPVPVTPEAIAQYERTLLESARSDEWQRRYSRLFREWTYPRYQPTHDRQLVDHEGAIWLRRFQTAGTQATAWTVFSNDGRWLGDVQLPEGLNVMEIGSDYILGVATDEAGVEYVRTYALARR
jgi:hypothetical protein